MSIRVIHAFDDNKFELEEGFLLYSDDRTKMIGVEHICKNMFHTSHFCGVVKLLLKNLKNDDDEPERAVLVVKPRFEITWKQIEEMIELISDEVKLFYDKVNHDNYNIIKIRLDIDRGISDNINGVYNENIVDEMQVTEFVFDIAMLYELYCRAEIKKELPPEWELAPVGEEKLVFEDEGRNKLLYLGGKLIPDIIIRHKSTKTTVIFDVKFKDGRSGQSHRDDRLQILAYQYMYNASVIGHILPKCSNKLKKEIKSPLGEGICDYYQLELHPNKPENFGSNLGEVLTQALEDKKNEGN